MLRHTATLFIALATLSADANDWPQWKGPTRDLASGETGLLKQWPESGPPRLWLFENAGEGYSGPAIVGGKLYTMGARGDTATLFVLDAATGEELWSRPLAEEYTNNWGDGPRGTPTVDGDRVYCLTGNGTLACVTTAGEPLWSINLEDLGGEVPMWGYSESPLVDGQKVVVTPGGPQGAVAALDKMTGRLLWQSSDVEDGAHYSSVMPATINGQAQYVQLVMERLIGLSSDDGSLLWETPWAGRIAVIPTPAIRGNQIYITTGYGVGCKMVTIEPGNTVTEAYQNKTMKNHHGGVVELDGYVYGHSDKVGWLCQEWATGKRVWRERKSLGKGALGYADGMLYLVSENEGEVALVAPSPEGWDERGRFTLDPQTEIRKPEGKIWTHPVVVDGRLYLRDQDLIYCYDVAGQ